MMAKEAEEEKMSLGGGRGGIYIFGEGGVSQDLGVWGDANFGICELEKLIGGRGQGG